MAPTNRGVAKQLQNQRQTAATPVFNHDGTNIVVTPQSNSSSNNRQSFASLTIPFTNVPPGIPRNDGPIDSPFTQFTQQQQQSFNGVNMGMNPMAFNQSHHQQQQQFNSGDPLSASSSAPTPTPTPGPGSMNGHGFQGGYYGFGNNNNNSMRPNMAPPNSNPNNFYPNGAGVHTGSLSPMFGNGMHGMHGPEPFGSQQGQYSMPMNYNMGYGFPHHQNNNSQPFNMQGNIYNMMPFSPSSNGDFNSNYEPPSSSSSDTPPDRDFSSNGDAGMDMELEVDLPGGSYALLSPATDMLTSPTSDRASGGIGTENNSVDPVVKGEDFGPSSAALSPPLLGESKSITGTPTLSSMTKTTTTGVASKPSLPSSKEKEQNKQKLYRNRKSEFTNKMRDELLGMGMLPSTRVTHAPEIMSKTADTLRDYRELLELIQNKIEGMPTNIAAVPGAVKKLLNENSNVFSMRQPPPLSLAQQTQQPQQQQSNHQFKPDIKVPLGANMTGTANAPITGRVTRSGAHVY